MDKQNAKQWGAKRGNGGGGIKTFEFSKLAGTGGGRGNTMSLYL